MSHASTHEVTAADLCQDILVLLKRFKAALADVAESEGLTSMQLGALHSIHEGYATMGKVAQTMHCDASNITGIVDRLVAMGMVNRQEDSRDRRIKVLSLTPRGEAVLGAVTERLPDSLGCSSLEPADIADLHRLLRKLG